METLHRVEAGLVRNWDYMTYAVAWIRMVAPIPIDETLTNKRVGFENNT